MHLDFQLDQYMMARSSPTSKFMLYALLLQHALELLALNLFFEVAAAADVLTGHEDVGHGGLA